MQRSKVKHEVAYHITEIRLEYTPFKFYDCAHGQKRILYVIFK